MKTIKNFRRLAAAALVLGVAGSTTACDIEGLLDVADRDVVQEGPFQEPAAIGLAIAGARNNFQNSYSGGDAFVSVSALLADEFYSSGTFTTRTATDRRNQFIGASGNTSDGAYNGLQFARRALNDVTARVEAHEDFGPEDELFQELKALEGFSLVALAEGYCSAIPLSRLVDGEFQFGEPLTGRAVLDTAIARFDASLASGDNSLAAVGKGRALIDQGEFAAAAAAVAGVDMTFVYHIAHSESGGQNPVFGLQGNGRYSLSGLTAGGVTSEAGTGVSALAFVSEGAEFSISDNEALVAAGDARSPWFGPVEGFDENIEQFITLLYDDVGDDIPLASGVEAWLIRAEAELNDGDADFGTTLLNELRQNVETLMPILHERVVLPENELADLPIATTFAEGAAQLFHERGFWLLLTGHRLGDLRRQIYLDAYAADSHDDVYPTGEYHKGGEYGDDVVFPLHFDETNNPHFELSMCDVDDASID